MQQTISDAHSNNFNLLHRLAFWSNQHEIDEAIYSVNRQKSACPPGPSLISRESVLLCTELSTFVSYFISQDRRAYFHYVFEIIVF